MSDLIEPTREDIDKLDEPALIEFGTGWTRGGTELGRVVRPTSAAAISALLERARS